MASTQPTLEKIQRWLQAVMTNPAGVAAGIESDEARRHIDVSALDVERVILASQRESSLERLAVYGNAYYLRLLECLREFFPCLAEALGRETFDEFAVGYLQRYPSQSYTLHRLADRFVQFLAETRPVSDADWTGFVLDLARLELTIEQVFDAPGPEPDPWLAASAPEANAAINSWANLSPAELNEETRLVAATGLTLVQFAWPVSTYYTAWKRGQPLPWPEPQAQFVALLRRDYIVRRHELTRPMYELLSRLVAGTPLSEAISQVSAGEAGVKLFPDELREWFFQWSRHGLFVAAGR